MKSHLLSEILNLSVAERIQLVGDVWDGIAAEAGELPLTEEERQGMDRRLADVHANPGVRRPSAEVKTGLLGPTDLLAVVPVRVAAGSRATEPVRKPVLNSGAQLQAGA